MIRQYLTGLERPYLTPTAWSRLQKIAKFKETSVSELIENWARESEGE
jgi:hypothetical protein